MAEVSEELDLPAEASAPAFLSDPARLAPVRTYEQLFHQAIVEEQGGRWLAAASLFDQAIRADPNRRNIRYRAALAFYRAGNPERAESELGFHLEACATDPDALNLLGIIHKQSGRNGSALELFDRALRERPRFIEAQLNAGRLLMQQGAYQPAADRFRAVLRREPKHVDALAQLAWAYHRLRDAGKALACGNRAVAINRRSVLALANRGSILFELGRFADALLDLQRAHDIDPAADSITTAMAQVLTRLGRPQDSLRLFDEILDRSPGHVGALLGLGNTLFALDRLPEAIAAFRKAVAARPDDIYATARLCRSLMDCREGDESARAEEASALAHAALDRGPAINQGFSEFQSVFQRTADFEGMRKLGEPWPIIEATPTLHVSVLHNQLSAVRTEADRYRLLDLHRQWGERIGLGAATTARPIRTPAVAKRSKLRIGILSSDLRFHAIAYFAAPIFAHYDRSRVELYCYSFFPGREDAIQGRLARAADQFRVIQNQTDHEVASAIRADELDLLFELGGSTKHNRLELMAHRMAPIQASWLGYPHSAGVPAIDYILVDPFVRPSDPKLLIEQPFEMPESWVSFGALGFPDVPIATEPPAMRNGRITFGTMNSSYKFSETTIKVWSQVLAAVPASRFLFVRPECSAALFRGNISREFERNGIAPERLLFAANRRGQHLALYNEIDIALDAMPQTGGTTTCETLWMGVPVVTRVGPAFFERLSHSNLSNAGLPDLCCFSEQAFVAKAAELARDIPRLKAWRSGLRSQIKNSPLGQTERWVRNFEHACRLVAR